MNTTPLPASAGCKVSVTGSPEWTPIPETAAWLRSVVCLPAFMPRSAPSPHCGSDERAQRRPPMGFLLAVDGLDFYFAGRCRPRSPDALSPCGGQINHASGQVQFTVFYRLLPVGLTTESQTGIRRKPWLIGRFPRSLRSPRDGPQSRESLFAASRARALPTGYGPKQKAHTRRPVSSNIGVWREPARPATGDTRPLPEPTRVSWAPRPNFPF